MELSRTQIEQIGEMGRQLEGLGTMAITAATEAHALRISMIEAVADLQSALGRLKAALAESARRLGVEQ